MKIKINHCYGDPTYIENVSWALVKDNNLIITIIGESTFTLPMSGVESYETLTE